MWWWWRIMWRGRWMDLRRLLTLLNLLSIRWQWKPHQKGKSDFLNLKNTLSKFYQGQTWISFHPDIIFFQPSKMGREGKGWGLFSFHGNNLWFTYWPIILWPWHDLNFVVVNSNSVLDSSENKFKFSTSPPLCKVGFQERP